MQDNYHTAIERIVDKLHDQNIFMQEMLLEIKDIRHMIDKRLQKDDLPRVVRKPWYEQENGTDGKPPNCS